MQLSPVARRPKPAGLARLVLLAGLFFLAARAPAAPEPAKAAAPVAAATPGHVRLGDKQFYTTGPYVAFAAPWCANAKNGLVVGRDLSNSIEFDDKAFPAGVTIRSHAPADNPNNHDCGVYGYHHVAYGNYNGGVPKQAVTPRQVRALRRLTVDFALDYSGQGEFNVLQEFFLTSAAGQYRSHVLEIGYLVHPSASAVKFAESGRRYPDYVDPDGRTWRMFRAARYLMLLPQRDDLAAGQLHIDHLLKELVARKVLTGDEWFNGMAVGIEPVTGDSEMTIRKWQVDLR